MLYQAARDVIIGPLVAAWFAAAPVPQVCDHPWSIELFRGYLVMEVLGGGKTVLLDKFNKHLSEIHPDRVFQITNKDGDVIFILVEKGCIVSAAKMEKEQ